MRESFPVVFILLGFVWSAENTFVYTYLLKIDDDLGDNQQTICKFQKMAFHSIRI